MRKINRYSERLQDLDESELLICRGVVTVAENHLK